MAGDAVRTTESRPNPDRPRITRRTFLQALASLVPALGVAVLGKSMDSRQPAFQTIDVSKPFDTGVDTEGKENPPYVIKNNVITFEATVPPEKIVNSEGEINIFGNDKGDRIFTQIVGSPGKIPKVIVNPDGIFVVEYNQE